MKVSAIIPAYNEGPRIKDVLVPLVESDLIDEIIVVDDGSLDDTSDRAIECGVRVIKLKENGGKGAAISKGLEAASGEIILLLDADLIGLTKSHVEALLSPVIKDEADMSIGTFKYGRRHTDSAQNFTPQLNGQRCIKADELRSIEHLDESGYGVEVTINRYIKENDLRVADVLLNNLTQVTKEEKVGPVKGVVARVKMYAEIMKSIFTINKWRY